MLATKGFAAHSAGTALAPFSFERRDPGPHDVAIDITHCGVCHTDIHFINNDFGMSIYPMVPGHEIVGRVTAVGSAVKKFKPGDMAGVGCLVDSCRTCDSCAQGLEQVLLRRMGSHVQRPREGWQDGDARRLLDADRSGRSVHVEACPGHGARFRRTTALCGHHDLLADAALERAQRTEGGHRRPGRSRAYGREVRRRSRSRGDDPQHIAVKKTGQRSTGCARLHPDDRQRAGSEGRQSLRLDSRHSLRLARLQHVPRHAEAQRHDGLRRPSARTDAHSGAQSRLCEKVHRRFANRRPARDAGNAGFLRCAEHQGRCRSHPDPADRRRVQADAEERRQIPVRHRHVFDQ